MLGKRKFPVLNGLDDDVGHLAQEIGGSDEKNDCEAPEPPPLQQPCLDPSSQERDAFNG